METVVSWFKFLYSELEMVLRIYLIIYDVILSNYISEF